MWHDGFQSSLQSFRIMTQAQPVCTVTAKTRAYSKADRPSCRLAPHRACQLLWIHHAHAHPRRGHKRKLRYVADVCVRSPCRREQLPLTCRAFAAACDDIIWDSVRVDARQYKRQTWTAMTWERVEPWLSKRAGNICGIDLRCASPGASCCNGSCMRVRRCQGWCR